MTISLQVTSPNSRYPFEFDAKQLAWVVQNFPDVRAEPPDGNGSERAPYRMSRIGQWAGAATIRTQNWTKRKPKDSSIDALKALQRQLGPNRGLYFVAGCLMERSPDGEYSNYITDIADGGVGLSGDKGPGLPNGVSGFGRPRIFPRPDTSNMPVYEVKYQRLNAGAKQNGKPLEHLGHGSALAQQARRVLAGETRMLQLQSDELPGALTALFLAEVAREKRMLVLGLMLLDLIEAKIPGFTWQTAMTIGPDDMRGGVRHPMIGNGAQKSALNMFTQYNDVTRQSVRILACWLDVALAADPQWSTGAMMNGDEAPKGYGTKGLKQFGTQMGKTPEDDQHSAGAERWRFYNDVVLPLLRRRAATLDMMLAG